jgi:hypothetical protein
MPVMVGTALRRARCEACAREAPLPTLRLGLISVAEARLGGLIAAAFWG